MPAHLKPKQVAGSFLIFLAFGIILFPLLVSSKGLVKRRLCGRNLGLVGQALRLYAADHDQRLPQGVDASDKMVPGMWDGQPQNQKLVAKLPILSTPLAPYAKSPDIFRCPADTGGFLLESIANASPQDFPSEPSLYAASGLSYLFRTEIALRSARQKGYWPPANVAMLFDAYGHWHGNVAPLDRGTVTRDFLYLVKNYRYNVLFADGNVRTLGFDETQQTWRVRL